MFRILFLVLILMSSFAAAQIVDKTPAEARPEAVKIIEVGKAYDGEIKAYMDGFMLKLLADPTAQGYIINYGSNKEILKRERQIKKGIAFRRYDTARITLVRGGNEKVIRTQFWIVPEGAEKPTP
jgi:hypothetical protein